MKTYRCDRFLKHIGHPASHIEHSYEVGPSAHSRRNTTPKEKEPEARIVQSSGVLTVNRVSVLANGEAALIW